MRGGVMGQTSAVVARPPRTLVGTQDDCLEEPAHCAVVPVTQSV